MRFDDGTVMRLYRQTVEDCGLYPGKELNAGQMRELHEKAGAMSAKMRAVRIVAATSVSEGDLEKRLIAKGEDPLQARDAVKWMVDLDLVDDRKTAEQVVSRCVAKGYGLARARQTLYEKRIPREYWQAALENYPDQSEYILDFLRTKLAGSREVRDVRKVTDALLRRGHSYGQIRKGLEALRLDTDEFLEE